jgi:hypothetical protein
MALPEPTGVPEDIDGTDETPGGVKATTTPGPPASADLAVKVAVIDYGKFVLGMCMTVIALVAYMAFTHPVATAHSPLPIFAGCLCVAHSSVMVRCMKLATSTPSTMKRRQGSILPVFLPTLMSVVVMTTWMNSQACGNASMLGIVEWWRRPSMTLSDLLNYHSIYDQSCKTVDRATCADNMERAIGPVVDTLQQFLDSPKRFQCVFVILGLFVLWLLAALRRPFNIPWAAFAASQPQDHCHKMDSELLSTSSPSTTTSPPTGNGSPTDTPSVRDAPDPISPSPRRRKKHE